MGIGSFFINAERRRAVDFLQPLYEDSLTYLMSVNPKSTLDSSFKPISVTYMFYLSFRRKKLIFDNGSIWWRIYYLELSLHLTNI